MIRASSRSRVLGLPGAKFLSEIADECKILDLVWSCTYHHTMKRLSMNIPENLHKRLKRYCVETDKDMTDVVLKLIEEFLMRAEGKQKK